MQDLDIGQRQALIYRELSKTKTEAINDAQSKLGRFTTFDPSTRVLMKLADTLEMLLLLLWRHLEYYLNESQVQIKQIKASTPQIPRLVASIDFNAFRNEVPKKLGYILQKLEALDLVSRSYDVHLLSLVNVASQQNKELAVDSDRRFNHAYINTMCQRLRETSGLQESSPVDGFGDV